MRDPASVPGLVSAIRKNSTEHEQTSSAPSLQHNQGDQPVHEAKSQSHRTQTRQRHPITDRRLHTPPQSLTTAVTTLPAITTQRVTRSQTLCTTLQIQISAAPMETNATNQTTRAEVMQEHTDTVTDSPVQSTKRHRTRSQTGLPTSHLPSIHATEATQQSRPSTHNKTRCTSTGLLPRQTQNTTQTETDPMPGTHPPPASHRCPKRKTTPHPRKTWTSQP